jgi:hypothetical protein
LLLQVPYHAGHGLKLILGVFEQSGSNGLLRRRRLPERWQIFAQNRKWMAVFNVDYPMVLPQQNKRRREYKTSAAMGLK